MPMVSYDYEILDVEYRNSCYHKIRVRIYKTTEPTFWESINPFSKVQREVDQWEADYIGAYQGEPGSSLYYRLPDFIEVDPEQYCTSNWRTHTYVTML